MPMLCTIPYDTLRADHLRAGLKRYFECGVMPGGFLLSVLSGDLYGAVAMADVHSMEHLAHTVIWIRENAPIGSYGSAGAVMCYAEARRGER